MHGIGNRDGDRVIDWGKTSGDYSRFRPEYPESLWERLAEHGVGRPGQRVLDLGTGVGYVARALARRGCRVTGIDVAEGQVRQARRDAEAEGLDIRFLHGPAEGVDFPPGSFDLVTAGQSWLYLDHSRMIPAVKRLLAPGGRLVTCHFSWLPRQDATARETERLVLRHNPDWSAADWAGVIPDVPEWSRADFRVAAAFHYDEPIPFTHETWRGRIRACRGVGAALTPDEVARFDREHAELLKRTAPEEFTVQHRIDAHVFEPLAAGESE